MAFADSKSRFEDNLGNVFLCSVCCEKFKSPRILPCGHSFCHSCIASAVNSSCEHKEAPVGFNCPLCREFIPCFGDKKEWVNHFFLNKTLKHVIDISEKNLCGACEIENEEIQGVITTVLNVVKLCAKRALNFTRKVQHLEDTPSVLLAALWIHVCNKI